METRQNSITQAKILPLEPPRTAVRIGGRPPDAPLPRYLTQEELARFRKAVFAGGVARDMALFGLMYRFGLRAKESTRLLVEDLDLSRGRIRVRRVKNGDTKEFPLPRDLVSPLRRYLRKRPDKGPFLFTGRQSNNQRGLTVLRVQQLFKEYAAAAGLPAHVASHSLRHSIAVHSLEEGFGLEYVADLLGHTSIRSTAIYAKITSGARDEMIRRLDRSTHVVVWDTSRRS
jgi:integrase/recombinase XerD